MNAILITDPGRLLDVPRWRMEPALPALPSPRVNDARHVLEPLSEATKTALRRPPLAERDHLFLDVDADGRNFVAEAVGLQYARSDVVPTWAKRRNVHGVLMHDHLWGASDEARKVFNRIPERRPVKNSPKWILAGTDYTVLVLNSAWPIDKLVFLSEAAETLFHYLLERFFAQTRNAREAAEFKVNEKVPPRRGNSWAERTDVPLSDYQRAASRLASTAEGYGFLMDRGTGKTASTIQRVCDEASMLNDGLLEGGVDRDDGGKMMRVLIVCPNQVRLNWQREHAKFATSKGKSVVVRGAPYDRVRQLAHAIKPEDGHDWSSCIIGYDTLRVSLEYFREVPWDLVVCDESHFFKDPRTARFDVMKEMRDASRRRMILTGTPIGNTPFDLWSQLEFLGEGLSGFSTWKNFRKFFGRFEKQGSTEGYGVEKLLGLANVPLLQERLSRLTFAVTKHEAGLKLPDKVRDVHEVYMNKAQAELYEKVCTQLAVEIEDKLSGEVNQMTITNILTSLLRLSQITSGHIVWDPVVDPSGEIVVPKRVEEIEKLNPKVEACVELLTAEDRDPNGKTIIWCNWVPNIRALVNRFTELGIVHGAYYGATKEKQRQVYVDRFNKDPEFRVLIANPQTAGEGLNLIGYDLDDPERSETYCDHEIFFSINWSAILRGQAEDRAHRRGTRMPVRITDLIVPGTIDEDILERVNAKQDMAQLVTNISSILRSVLNISI